MPASAAQCNALKADATKVSTDQATLATDTAAQSSDQAAFAAALAGVVVVVNPDGTADIITPTPGTAPGYTVVTATVLA